MDSDVRPGPVAWKAAGYFDIFVTISCAIATYTLRHFTFHSADHFKSRSLPLPSVLKAKSAIALYGIR